MLDLLFNPSSIAVVGASNDPIKAGGRTLKGLIDSHYEGKLYPVNPKASKIMGLKCYKRVRDVPGEVDLAILNIPFHATLDAMADCAEKRVRFAIVHAAGFGETGAEGLKLETDMVAVARSGGTRIVGPNCMGIFCPDSRINTIAAGLNAQDPPPKSGPASFFGQSGWASETFILEGLERGLECSKVISIGNQCDLTVSEFLAYIGDDPKTRIVAGYVEGIRDGSEFLRAASRTSGKKPVIIWKSGKSQAGARAATSHTGALAGAAQVCDAAFRQAGILQADHLHELIDFAVAFTCPYRPSGGRVGILVEAGGGAVAAADACEANGLSVDPISERSQAELRELINRLGSPIPSTVNPVDVVWPPPHAYDRIITRAMELLLGECDAMLWITYSPLAREDFAPKVAEIMHKAKKPLFMVPTYPSMMSKSLGQYVRLGIPSFPTSERAVKGLAALVKYASRFGGEAPG